MANASASSPINQHFFQPLLPGFHSHINIPIAFFSNHIEGNAVVKLRSDASGLAWEVKMDGRRLTEGWQKFATSHDLRVGDIVIFRHVGGFLFHVTAFGPSCCEIQYDKDDDDDDVVHILSDSDSDKYHQDTREAGSLADNSCFVARVTASNLSKDMLFLPKDFSRSNGLMNRKCEIILLNEDGKPWTVFLTYHKTKGCVYIKSGWRSFCRANGKRVYDLLTFKTVKTGTRPVLKLCSSMYNRDCFRASSSSSSASQDRFLTLTLTTCSFKKFKLCLPGKFVWLNSLDNARKITLVDRYGIKRTTTLEPDNNNGRMRLGKEWIEFCGANGDGLKVGESFKVELIKEEEDTTTPVLKFHSEVLNSL